MFTGLYDTWVARDICGTPMRAFWPYAKDAGSIRLIKEEKPFRVAACWNGAIAMPAGPYKYAPPPDTQPAETRLERRGWRMMDNGELCE